MKHLAVILLSAVAVCAFAQDSRSVVRQGSVDPGKQEEQRSCVQCHSLRLVEGQRLSQAAWDKELTKMMGWGAPVTNRQMLLDYLSQHYGICVPRVPDPLSGNGAKGQGSSQ